MKNKLKQLLNWLKAHWKGESCPRCGDLLHVGRQCPIEGCYCMG